MYVYVNSGANPAIVNYSVSVVKIYNTTCSLVRFEKEKYFLRFCKNALAYYNAEKIVNLSVVGLVPGQFSENEMYRRSGKYANPKGRHVNESKRGWRIQIGCKIFKFQVNIKEVMQKQKICDETLEILKAILEQGWLLK
jgi:hypothetical protein